MTRDRRLVLQALFHPAALGRRARAHFFIDSKTVESKLTKKLANERQ